MAKPKTVHRCTECGAAAPRWAGRCPSCGEWNTLIEEIDRPVPSGAGLRGAGAVAADRPTPIAEVDPAEWQTRPTGIGEVDRVLGGGLVPGSVTLVGGEPGIGKSTLLLQLLANLAATNARCLLVSAEESKQQVRLRAERLGALHPELLLLSETDITAVIRAIDDVKPDIVVVDSIQTVFDPDMGSAPGSVAQVRECAHALTRLAKERATTVVLVGHVTKEGALAGPRVLEHLVDTVLSFEGERHHALRLLRAVKHRYGATGELGLFEMGDEGLVPVPDPSGLFLGDRHADSPGSVVVPAMEGHRPLLVEVQALVSPTDNPGMARRSAQGVDSGRLGLLVAVLARHVRLDLGRADVFVSAVGGVKVTEPGADLALGLAIASAHRGAALAPDLVACGEVGLGGELRQVHQTRRRLAEAARLGFTAAIVPASAPDDVKGLRVRRVSTLEEAIRAANVPE